MKLAQALIERKALFQRITDLKSRTIENCSKVQNEEPTEDPDFLLAELDGSIEELGTLINRINKTNNSFEIENSHETISEAIVRRDMLKMQIDTYQLVLTNSNPRTMRANRYDSVFGLDDNNEKVRIVPTLDSGTIRTELDSLSKEYRELDTLIQAANWTHDLVD